MLGSVYYSPMEQLLRRALAGLGCDDKEIRLYLACYLHGTAPLSELISRTNLRRSTAYLVSKSLVDKGLLVEDHKAYGKSLGAVEPETLMRLVATRQRQMGRQHLALKEHLGELQALYQTSEIRPRVRTFQGPNGLLTVWRDILSASYASEILIWTNQASEGTFFSPTAHKQFITERRAGGHYARVLAVDNPAGRKLQASDADNLRETRLLPPGVTFSAETYVYDHKTAVLDYNQDIMGVITESEQVATAQRAMFEAAWQAAATLSSAR